MSIQFASSQLDISIDESSGFVEASTDRTNTSNAAALRRISIPLVAIAFDLDGYHWAEQWLNQRAAQGIHAEELGCLLPAPCVDGAGWTKRRMSTSELAEWTVQFLLSRGEQPESVKNLGAHSFKATLLSWCAKAGVSTGSRRMLGNHTKPKDKMVVTYSREQLFGTTGRSAVGDQLHRQWPPGPRRHQVRQVEVSGAS